MQSHSLSGGAVDRLNGYYGWKACIAFVVAIAVAMIAFRAFPSVERALAGAFLRDMDCGAWSSFNPDAPRCGVFHYWYNPFLVWTHKILNALPPVLFVITLIVLGLRWRGEVAGRFARIATPLIGVVSFLLGPVLIVNGILKSFWGRPRPFSTIDLGRFNDYVLPGTISDQCARNCSFVSGDVAAAFWLFWLVPLVPARYREPFIALLALNGCLMIIFRMAAGRHYLSDTVIAALLSLLIVLATANWVRHLARTRH